MLTSHLKSLACLLLIGLALPATSFADVPVRQYHAGSRPVESSLQDWHDPARNRTVPVKIYAPKDLSEPAPIILFSHGLGGSRTGYGYLGQQWASHGAIVIHLQHQGSDSSLIDNDLVRTAARLQLAAGDPTVAINRPKDVTFTINKLEELNRTDGPWKEKLNLGKIGLAGHSYGAWTTLVAIGQRTVLPGGVEVALDDRRIKAAICMSSPVIRLGSNPKQAFREIRVPVMHMTGTLDDMPVSHSPAKERRIPFDLTSASDQFLITFEGGDHMVFSGVSKNRPVSPIVLPGMTGDRSKDPVFQKATAEGTTAFWKAYLADDQEARRWLAEGGYSTSLGQLARFESKGITVKDSAGN